MVFDNEAFAKQRIARQIERALVQIENVFAAATLKMLVVPALRCLEARFARGENYALNLPGISQQSERAINRGKTNWRVFAARGFVDFRHGQWPVGFGDDAQNRVALARLTLPQKWGRRIGHRRDVYPEGRLARRVPLRAAAKPKGKAGIAPIKSRGVW